MKKLFKGIERFYEGLFSFVYKNVLWVSLLFAFLSGLMSGYQFFYGSYVSAAMNLFLCSTNSYIFATELAKRRSEKQ
jgi:hypothetical protein